MICISANVEHIRRQGLELQISKQVQMNNRITNADELTSALPFGNMVLPAALMQSEIMNKIIVEVYNGWPGQTGLKRVKNVVTFLCERVPQYAKVMGKTEIETLELFAKSRNCNYTNYFQNAKFPDLSEVYVFDTIEDVKAKFPSKQYQCPCCGGISTNYQECNSGKTVDKKGKEVCDCKVYGLFGDMGKELQNNEQPQPQQPQLDIAAVMPRFFARGQFAMWVLNIEYNGKEWTSMCTDDHIRDKDIIIKKAIEDLKEEGLVITESDVKYWDCRWNLPLF